MSVEELPNYKGSKCCGTCESGYTTGEYNWLCKKKKNKSLSYGRYGVCDLWE